MSNQDLYYKALYSVAKLFGDTSVSKEKCKLNLKELIDEIGIMLESLGETE